MAFLHREKFYKQKLKKCRNEHSVLRIHEDYLSSYEQLLENAKMSSLQIRRQRTMALETFKIINQFTPVCLQNMVNVKKSKYSFRYSNIVDIPQVKTTAYGKESFRYAAAAM